tara:strand:+ start:849 stop:1067 length:219 start_codon:yes stop_codon:yes gene_type:complete
MFLIYLEISPKLTNIWLRKDSENITRFHLHGIIAMLLKPLTDAIFWNPFFWDINYYIGAYIFTLILDKCVLS